MARGKHGGTVLGSSMSSYFWRTNYVLLEFSAVATLTVRTCNALLH